MVDLAVALVWHQHQPYYPDDVAGSNPMPWVRLHGTKDYWGMAQHLAEVPEMHATINLVPSLVAQILAYTDLKQQDEHLRISRLPADSLTESDKIFLLDNFFMVNPDQMIRPHPRYFELYQQRALGSDDAHRAMRRFAIRDLLDLQCWSNLVWFHPLALERDADLAAFQRKGQDWTEEEKQWMLDKQMELLAEVIPLHRKLAQRGQVELTTTPFYHPILPLLVDKSLAREAMPNVELPRHLDSYAEDAAAQLRRAVEYHARIFGSKPVGLWPSEGSVAQSIVPLVAGAGIKWMASDEEILSRSTEGRVSRDPQGLVRHPELLYRPWLAEEAGQKVQMIFRDHALSDNIGFHYQRWNSQQAADDLVGKLEAIAAATKPRSSQPALVSIILDGENCWEYYPNSGVEFLRGLYQRLAHHPRIKPMRVRDYLKEYPATERIPRLSAGSWISHNFGIWIGHPACNRAWDLVTEARGVLTAQAAEGKVEAHELARAWEELFIAEGSDWFWWFDDQHSSSQDWLFDELFRRHLQNVYTLLGLEPPAELMKPLAAERAGPSPVSQPTGPIDVKINGTETYFEWVSAGEYVWSAARGTMTMAEPPRLERLFFGFSVDRLFLRFDTVGPVHKRLSEVDAVRVVFFEPKGFELLIARPASAKPKAQLYRNNVPVSAAGVEAAADIILEVGVPWRSLGVAGGAPVHFYVELLANNQPLERMPSEGAVETVAPSADYELMMWQA